MKVLALHLPAFHQIPENDEWWGEGFTEWDNVRSGRPLYDGHHQPVVPLNGHYYDLSEEKDIAAQMRTAKEYGLYGFIYYHYWFGNGRMLFEKPCELIKDRIDEDFHYCFCWANETWVTTWHGAVPNTLIKQEYPGLKDWEMHYNYLIEFFRDKRYVLKDNKPVFFIYKPNQIPDYDLMVEYWDERAKKDGFDGIFIVEFISSKNTSLYSAKSGAVAEFEPLYTTFFDLSKFNLFRRFICKKTKRIDYQDYNKLWKKIIDRKRTYHGKPVIRGCFVGWDNSPRKGNESMIVKGCTPQAFEENLRQMVGNNRPDADDEFIMINAWNEWSEGAYLEPDERNKYAFLEAVKRIVDAQ